MSWERASACLPVASSSLQALPTPPSPSSLLPLSLSPPSSSPLSSSAGGGQHRRLRHRCHQPPRRLPVHRTPPIADSNSALRQYEVSDNPSCADLGFDGIEVKIDPPQSGEYLIIDGYYVRIQTDGAVVGQINGLAVVSSGPLSYGFPSRITSTIGAATDFESEGLRRLLVNATYWCLNQEEKIPANANVETVDDFQPTPFGFRKYQRGIKPADHAMAAGP